MQVIISSGVFNAQDGTCYYLCSDCCDLTNPQVIPEGLAFAIGLPLEAEMSLEDCEGDTVDPTEDADWYADSYTAYNGIQPDGEAGFTGTGVGGASLEADYLGNVPPDPHDSDCTCGCPQDDFEPVGGVAVIPVALRLKPLFIPYSKGWLGLLFLAACLLVSPAHPQGCGPGPRPIPPGLAQSAARAQVIVVGIYEGASGFAEGPRTGHFLVQRVLRGAVEPGNVDIDMTGTEVVVPVGQGTLALLQWEGHLLRPVNMRHFCGQFSFLPADWRGFSPGVGPVAEAVHVVGKVLADEGAPTNRRQTALLALCGVAAADPALVAASASANLKIRFGAMACRIAQGDIGLLGRLARKFAVEAPPPEAADLTYAILGIRDPDAVPALSAMARAKLVPLRTAAIEALGDTHSLAALPALRYALVHGDFVTRWAAVRALPYILGGKAEVLTQDNFRAQEATITKNWLACIAAAGVHGN